MAENVIEFRVSPAEFEQILNALATRPYCEVAGLLNGLVTQANAAKRTADCAVPEPQEEPL